MIADRRYAAGWRRKGRCYRWYRLGSSRLDRRVTTARFSLSPILSSQLIWAVVAAQGQAAKQWFAREI